LIRPTHRGVHGCHDQARAKALTSGTALTFASQAEPRLSDLSLAGASLNPAISGATVEIHPHRAYLPLVHR
jgi:hypothetical protein